MNKKYIILIIIVVAILLLIFRDSSPSKDSEPLPTRDTEGIEGYASISEFCKELSKSQEFDDQTREKSFYESCLVEYQ